MKKSIGLWALWGFAFSSFFGTLLHFLFEWTNNSLIVAPFSGVNESTWEHMKLLFWPMLIFAIIESFFFKQRRDFWSIKLKGILIGLLLIPIIFYTINGVFGKTPDFINIAIFFVSLGSSYLYEFKALNDKEKFTVPKIISMICILVIGASFVLFTFKTPEIGVFRDPITLGFGIQ